MDNNLDGSVEIANLVNLNSLNIQNEHMRE